jgi:cyclopropane fatty-acyl-phospholipid synthase-like methyltransferase
LNPSQLPGGALDPERVNELSRRFWESAILRAGIKLGIFALLEGQALSADAVARRIDAHPRFVQALLDACVALGLLESAGGGDDAYRNSPLASRCLLEGKPHYVGDLVLHITNHWASWGQLDRLVREGRTLLPFESGYVDAPTYWTDYMMGQHNRAAAGQAENLVRHVELRGRRRLLDLGGGAGSYSIALCLAYPQLQAVVVDREEPLAVARGLVQAQGLEKRITLVEGDFHAVELGRESDVVLVSGVVLIKGEEECRRLLRRAYDALLPGGLVIIQDFMRLEESPQRRHLDTLMDLYALIAFDPGAGDRPGAAVAAWLQEAGFTNLQSIPLPTHLGLVTGEKPGGS